MRHKPDPEMIDQENPEWTQADFDHAVPFSSLPPEMQKKLASGPHVVVVENQDAGEFVAVPLARDLVARFRETGPDWQARINVALAEWLSNQSPFDSD